MVLESLEILFDSHLTREITFFIRRLMTLMTYDDQVCILFIIRQMKLYHNNVLIKAAYIFKEKKREADL